VTPNSSYACLKKQSFSATPYTLLPLREEDIFAIKRWRNAQLDILRQSYLLTDDMQKNYFQHTIEPSFDNIQPAQILFSFLHHDVCVGYGGLVHISWDSKRAEVSFLVDPHRSNQPELYDQDFTAFLSMIKQVAFSELQFHRLFTETFDMRPKHVEILEQQHFLFEGRMKDHVLIKGAFVDSLIHGYINERDAK
jgi:RimJ/RimL family protein N-acetyltransferase